MKHKTSQTIDDTPVQEMMEATLGSIAASDINKALVCKKYGIDFCCGGKRTLQQACDEKKLDAAVIAKALQEAEKLSNRQNQFDQWPLAFLADYIINQHHAYVRKNLPEINFYARKVMKVHGSEHPELIDIYRLVEHINQEMLSHMEKEETILFPYIKSLEMKIPGQESFKKPAFTSVSAPISMMETEHEEVGAAMAAIRLHTNDYKLPEGACASYDMLYRLLKDFEEDLHIHIHLENNILFPKAIML